MALTRTTLSSAVGVDDTSIVVASATGFATGRLLRIDQEFLQVAQSYNGTATTIPVLRGREGSLTSAHRVDPRRQLDGGPHPGWVRPCRDPERDGRHQPDGPDPHDRHGR